MLWENMGGYKVKISRLDKIIQNNISFSSQRKLEEQAVYILQDISETLAMIYDKLCDGNAVTQASEEIVPKAFIIPFDNLKDYETMHFDHVDFPQGYDISFIRYETFTSQDKFTLEKKIVRYAIVNAFGQEMQLKESEYGKKWRCWNITPSSEERTEWEK